MTMSYPRRALIAAAAAACLAAPLVAARAQAPSGGPRRAELSPAQKVSILQSVALIGGAYREWARDYNARDAEAICRWMERYCTADFSMRPRAGKARSLAEQQASIRASIPALRPAEPAAVKLRQVRILGDAAVVVVSVGRAGAPAGGSGALAPRAAERYTRDTWVRSGEDWRLRRSEEIARADVAGPRSPAGGRSAGPVRTPPARRR